MKSFKDHLLTETPMSSTFEDIYKRKNKENFFNKAVKGELELEKGGKVKAISKDVVITFKRNDKTRYFNKLTV